MHMKFPRLRKHFERPVHICASLPAVLSREEGEQWPPFVCCNHRSMIVWVLGGLPRLFVVDFGHFELWHSEVNQVRDFDGVSFAGMFGMGLHDLEQCNAD
jgi:hypothetical protein